MIKLLKLFHNNLPIRATKTGGFFLGVRQNNFLKLLRFLIFWLRLKRFPKPFQSSHPAQLQQSGRLLKVVDKGNFVSFIRLSLELKKRTKMPINHCVIQLFLSNIKRLNSFCPASFCGFFFECR